MTIRIPHLEIENAYQKAWTKLYPTLDSVPNDSTRFVNFENHYNVRLIFEHNYLTYIEFKSDIDATMFLLTYV